MLLPLQLYLFGYEKKGDAIYYEIGFRSLKFYF